MVYPDYRAHSVTDISVAFLREKNILGIILDLDGNLIGYRDKTIDPKVLQWLKTLSEEGIKICILTNPSYGSTLKEVNVIMKLEAFSARVPKPLPVAFTSAIHFLNISPHQIAMIGDQLFTDILGGTLRGMLTIWTDNRPGAKEGWWTRQVNRRLEKWYTDLFLTRNQQHAPYITSSKASKK